jgi:tryptophanyl-tRNA synthetase
MFIQSSVLEHAELQLLLSMVTPLGWLERVPTYKEALDNVKDKDLHTYGFLGYPVLQSADIVMYDADIVPVGEDQESHVELTREIVRRSNLAFGNISLPSLPAAAWSGLLTKVGIIESDVHRKLLNYAYAGNAPGVIQGLREVWQSASLQDRGYYVKNEIGTLIPLLKEPAALLTRTPRIPGLDGRKMSKSYGNAITLSESDADIRAKTKVMLTDPARKRRTDPGNPDICPVYDWHKLFSPPETLAWSAEGCRSAGIGCIECKMAMADNLIKWIEPVRARREEYAAHPDKVLRILDDGSMKAREVAQKTMARVREAVFNWKEKREEVTKQKSTTQNAKVGD